MDVPRARSGSTVSETVPARPRPSAFEPLDVGGRGLTIVSRAATAGAATWSQAGRLVPAAPAHRRQPVTPSPTGTARATARQHVATVARRAGAGDRRPSRGHERPRRLRCGDGRVTQSLAEQIPGRRCVGSTVPGMIARWRRRRSGLSFEVGAAETMMFGDEFDLVVSSTRWLGARPAPGDVRSRRPCTPVAGGGAGPRLRRCTAEPPGRGDGGDLVAAREPSFFVGSRRRPSSPIPSSGRRMRSRWGCALPTGGSTTCRGSSAPREAFAAWWRSSCSADGRQWPRRRGWLHCLSGPKLSSTHMRR